MAWQDLYGSRYLNSDDLKSGPIQTSILKWEVSQVGKGANQSTKILLTLEGVEKQLALNTVNCQTLVELFGPNEDDWIDKKIELYSTPVMFEGKMQKGVRIKSLETKSSKRR